MLGLGDIGPEARAARDGGQGDAVQGVRRRRRVPDLPRDEGRRRDRRASSRRSRRSSAGSTSRTSRRRAASRSSAGCASRSTSRSSTTTSTGRRSSSLAALLNALRVVGKRPGGRAVVHHRRRRGRRRGRRRCCSPPACATSSAATARAPSTAARPGLDARRRPSTPSVTNPRGSRGSADEALAGADVFIGALRRRARSRVEARRARWPRTRSSSRWRTRRPRCRPRTIEGARRGHRHRPLRLPEPDQQRARVPRRLPRRARRARLAITERDEARRRRTRSPPSSRPRSSRPDYIIPSVFNRDVAPAVAAAVARAAEEDGVARRALPGSPARVESLSTGETSFPVGPFLCGSARLLFRAPLAGGPCFGGGSARTLEGVVRERTSDGRASAAWASPRTAFTRGVSRLRLRNGSPSLRSRVARSPG